MDDDAPRKEVGEPYFIIYRDGQFWTFWSVINTISCLTSSYFYAYIAAFEIPPPGSFLFIVDWTYEVIFFMTLCFNFLVDFQVDGEPKPVRDYKRIAQRYLSGNFIIDFIPIVPLYMLPLGGYEKHLYLVKVMRLYAGLKIFDLGGIKK